jgi:hypothetical protein
MLPRIGFACAVVVALTLSLGAVLAKETEATVVSYDKETMKLAVKEGAKERTVQLAKNTHVHYPDKGRIKEVSLKDRPNYLKKGVRIAIEEEDGKLVEINIIADKK